MNGREPDRKSGRPPGSAVMVGGDYYNRHSECQQNAIQFGLPLLERAIHAIPLPDPGNAILVADYGSSEGRNSVEVMREVVRLIRRRAPESVPIAIVHNDQPANDFRSLFTLVDERPESYLRTSSNVFCYATGHSFFERVFPPQQVSLGWSSIAVHWMSDVPAPIPNHIWNTCAPSEVHAAWAKQAREDWQRFLGHRAQELRPGGRLVIIGGGKDSRGASGAEGLAGIANAIFQDMVHKGSIQQDEYVRMAVPAYNRSQKEFEEPFATDALRGLLVLEEYRQVPMQDPAWLRYQQDRDALTFAGSLTGFFRAFTEHCLFGDLDPGRPPGDRQRLADEFYASLQRRIAEDPVAAHCEWQFGLLLIARKDR
jgi:hypothetical protein